MKENTAKRTRNKKRQNLLLMIIALFALLPFVNAVSPTVKHAQVTAVQPQLSGTSSPSSISKHHLLPMCYALQGVRFSIPPFFRLFQPTHYASQALWQSYLFNKSWTFI